jgi:hypothetical protein
MSLKWWEKTVEYQFVLLVAPSPNLFLAPLDSGEERTGDAVFSSKNRWLLIEFKKDQSSISTEKKKFVNYDDAKNALQEIDDHHYIIYGQESKESIQRLQLVMQTYFSRKERELTDFLNSGAEYEVFKEYVEQYTKFKKSPAGGNGGSSGGVTMDDLALVAGVNTDKDIVECLSLSEFLRQTGLDQKLELDQKSESKRGGPSR